MTESRSVAVVGGGVSGLAAAYEAARRDTDVVLLEASPRLGGKVHTEMVDGFLVEAGPDSFVAPKRSVLELAADLGIADRVIPASHVGGAHVWWGGRLHPLPEGLLLMAPSRLAPLFRSSLLSWRGKLRVLGDLVLPSGANGDESLDSFVRRRLGSEVLERIAEPLVAGIHAARPDTMSLRASFPRFLDMERNHRSLILAARRARRQSRSQGSHFMSFMGGMGELAGALVGALPTDTVRTGVAVNRITARRQRGYRLETDDGGVIEAEGVVLATPAAVTARLLETICPEAADLVRGIGQVSTATVTLAYRADEIPPLTGSGFVVPSAAQRKVMGVSYLSNKWTGRVPDDGYALIRAFVRGSDRLADEDRLVETARAEIAALIGITAEPAL
ncbi:MAG TPA: protoporphyrinogen oxidase, partial [Acidimicrobiia bacterium]|nr:protoporphyrinogen oxidase [Acidimicrobiia bacterium]